MTDQSLHTAYFLKGQKAGDDSPGASPWASHHALVKQLLADWIASQGRRSSVEHTPNLLLGAGEVNRLDAASLLLSRVEDGGRAAYGGRAGRARGSNESSALSCGGRPLAGQWRPESFGKASRRHFGGG